MSDKIFAGDSFFTAAGLLNTSSKEPLSVVFIGGSLTSGDIDYEGTSLEFWMKWPVATMKYLAGLFPSRKIKAFNAGLGGTGSGYGAMRFARDVLAHEPDLVFIEFSVNDAPKSSELPYAEVTRRQMYLESMIRQAMEMDKVPAIVYVHTPMPMYPQTPEYLGYKMMNEMRNQLFNYYGIGVIDIMQSVISEYDARHALNPSLTMEEFYSEYYKRAADGVAFDVHPNAGYELFSTAVINALSREPERYFRPFKMRDRLYCEDCADVIFERFNYLPATDSRITYRGEWRTYTKDNPFETDDSTLTIPLGRYDAISFPDGLVQTEGKGGEYFEFDTDAKRICFPHVSARRGLDATLYCNGEELSPVVCSSIYHGMNYSGKWIELPKGRNHVKVVVNIPDEEHILFRYGYVIECF